MYAIQTIKEDEILKVIEEGKFHSIENRTLPSKNKREYFVKYDMKHIEAKQDLAEILALPERFAEKTLIVTKNDYNVRMRIGHDYYLIRFYKTGKVIKSSKAKLDDLYKRFEAYKTYIGEKYYQRG